MRSLREIATGDFAVLRAMKRLAGAILLHSRLVARVELRRGGVLYVDLANAVGRTIWLRRDYESEAPITDLVIRNLRPGDAFFDVGANVGFFSVVAASQVGPAGRVVAFEPLPALVRLLGRTIAANTLGNIEIVGAAVGRSEGQTRIAAMRDSAYSHLIEGARLIDRAHGGWRAVDVPRVSLDGYAASSRLVPRLVKMDIEGAEMDALAGATRLLAHPNGPDVICEVGFPHLARFGHTPEELFAEFERYGYRAFHPRTRRPMIWQELSEHEYNVFFRHPSRNTDGSADMS